MSYIGNTNTTQAFTPAVDFFSGNASTTAFTLSRPVASVAQVQAVISNVPQDPGSAYTVSGSTITFTSAPPSGTNNIYVSYTSPITQVIAPGQGTVTTTSLAGGTVTTTTDATINGLTVGRGGGAVASNTAVGASALAANQAGGTSNTAIGNAALDANTTGDANTAIGDNALGANTTASNNTAMGYQALQSNTTGSPNSAIGFQTLYSNVTGTNNVAVGHQALYYNTVSSNTAIGYQALIATTTAGDNTGVGSQVMATNTTGSSNTAMGVTALLNNTTGSNNVAIGKDALRANTTGAQNIGLGFSPGATITTGTFNTCIGYSAGSFGASLTTGTSNVYIGANAGPSGAAVSNELLICGTNSQGKGSNTGFINPNGGGVYQGNNSSSWSTTSDQRLKKNIVDNTGGLSKITGIRVRNFEYRIAEEVTELPAHAVIDKQGVQLGVIAQELQTVLPDCVKTESTGVMSVDTDNLIWYMVNSIKEQQALITALTARITALENT